MSRWCVYMVRCRDGALYTGVTTDVRRRLAEHRSSPSRGARFLRGRGPLELVFVKEIGARRIALRVEGRIKKLPKALKEGLVAQGALVGALAARTGGELRGWSATRRAPGRM